MGVVQDDTPPAAAVEAGAGLPAQLLPPASNGTAQAAAAPDNLASGTVDAGKEAAASSAGVVGDIRLIVHNVPADYKEEQLRPFLVGVRRAKASLPPCTTAAPILRCCRHCFS